eukprot:CAMPEP_0117818170 /NCGR_PEP_ID=MMETSP0949-20121206/1094_1 /TAXON_ID=44440 /ORGANISM="Chattonella subsalsa, Strain CCMP2191" /LENGTH=315 /DNA_ID=CAMNT_0005656645 /DNA_START=172 /DNA_END=1119 /DNA_ORIENTATION=-
MSIIGADDQWGNYAVISCAAAAGIKLESTFIGKSLSGPICSMLLTAILTNIGILPADPSPYVGSLQGFVVKIATPLLLLGADVVKIIHETGRLLLAFAIAACSTLLGLAVDNVLGLFYFPLVSWLGRNEAPESLAEDKGIANESAGPEEEITLQSAAMAVGVATALPIVTALTVTVATLFAPSLKSSVPSGELLGKLFLFLFFASVGASSGTVTGTLLSPEAVVLALFGLILYTVHLGMTLSLGNILGIPLKELLVASNASIGNAATASAMATAKRWDSLFLPSLLVGSAGNSLGTFAGLWLGVEILQRIIFNGS